MKTPSCLRASVRRTGTRRAPLALGIAALAALALGTPARAASYYWAGDNQGSSAWNILTGLGGSNWSSSGDFNQGTSGATALPGINDDVFFILNGAGNLTNTLGADFSIKSLTFNSFGTSPITIGGANTLTIGTGGITNGSASTVTLSTNVALGGVQTWANNNATPFALSGVLSGAAGNNLTLGGRGTFTFSNANTYSGSTSVFTGGLTLNGTGSILNTSAISLNAGTSLVLDNTATNVANRIADNLTITTKGATISFIGNAGTTAETVGTLAVGSGASVVQTSGSVSSLTFGAAGGTPIASFSRSVGGTALFAVGAGSTVNAPTLTLNNGIIGGWAVTGTAAGTGLNFATTDGSNNVVPYAAYTALTADGTGALNSVITSTDNTKYDATGNNSVRLQAAVTTINSLYLTGGSTLSGVTGGPAGAPSTFYNGITFGTGITADLTKKLVVTSGGIIASGVPATNVGHYNNKADIANMAFIGYQFGEYTAGGQTNGDSGQITAGAGVADLVVYTDSNLRIASQIVDNGTPLGLTKSGPGILDIGNGNTQTNKPSNLFTGKVTINEGILLIGQASQLGNSAAAADNVTFNGGELRTFAGTSTSTTQGWTVGTRGGAFSYTGGGTSNIQNKITGAGGFTFYARSAGGGANETINLATAAAQNADYQGATNLLWSISDGTFGSGTQYGKIAWGQNNQIPAQSAVTMNIVDDTAAHNVLANTGGGIAGTFGVSADFAGKTDHFGSLAGNVNLRNFNTGTLTLGANNLSTVYTGSLYGAAAQTSNSDTTSPAGTGTLIKVGSGTQTFAGTRNNYTGPTSIIGGTLLIGSGTTTTSTASLTGSTVTVGNGTLTGALGGNGTISGAVIVTSTGHLAPAMSATTTNTLTIGANLTLNAGASLDYNFGALGNPGTSDLVTVGGAFNLTLNAGVDILNITQLPGFGIGTYNLLTAPTGAFTNNATFTINGKNNFNYAVASSGNSLVLTVSAGNPILTYIGNGSSAFQNGGPANFNNGSAAVAFANTNNVIFDENLTGSPNVVVDAAGVLPNSVLIDNSATNYTFSGGTITIATNLTKQQGAAVTFNSNVTVPITTITGGAVTVGVGTTYNSTSKLDVTGAPLTVNGTLTTPALNVKAGASATIASGATLTPTALSVLATGTATINAAAQSLTALTGGGTLALVGGTALTITGGASFAGSINGTGASLTVNAPAATVTLAGTNGYDGSTTINAGTLQLGDGATDGTINASGVLDNGTLAFNTTGTQSYAGPITGSGNLVKSGGGVQTLSGTNTYVGTTTISGGVLAVGQISDAGPSNISTAALSLTGSGSTLRYTGTGAATTTRNVTVSATGAQFEVSDVAGTLTLVGNAQGIFTGNGGNAITKIGPGTLVLSGTGNDTAVQFNVAAGTLNLDKSNAASSVAVDAITDITGGATVRVTGTGGSQFWPGFTGQNLTINNGGTFDLNGHNESGITAIGGGNGTITNALAATSATLTVGANNQGGSYGGSLASGTGGFNFVKAGTGTQILTGNNTNFAGNFTVNAGTLQFGADATAQASTNSLGANTVGRLVTIATGATVDFEGRDIGLGSVGFLVNGGTITAGAFKRLGPVTLNGGTINTSNTVAGSSANFQSATFEADVTVGGSTPSTISSTGTTGFLGIHLEKAGGVTFNVADVTGSPAVDLLINSGLINKSNNAGAGALTKSGLGTLRLAGANTYTGATNVNAGTLLVGSSINGSLVNVNAGGTLGGVGTISTTGQPVTLAAGGFLSPGAGVGTLTVDTGIAQLDISTGVAATATHALVFELGPIAASDKVMLLGSSVLNIGTGGANSGLAFDDFTFTNVGGLQVGTYTLFDGVNPIAGTFDTNSANLTGSLGGTFTGTIGFGDGTNDIILNVVPEPGSVALLAGGLGVLLGLRRRRA